jgi:hypothetical protein
MGDGGTSDGNDETCICCKMFKKNWLYMSLVYCTEGPSNGRLRYCHSRMKKRGKYYRYSLGSVLPERFCNIMFSVDGNQSSENMYNCVKKYECDKSDEEQIQAPPDAA